MAALNRTLKLGLAAATVAGMFAASPAQAGERRDPWCGTPPPPRCEPVRVHRDRPSFYFSIGNSYPVTQVVTRQVYIPGHYETRTEQVQVSQGHYETRILPAVYEDRCDDFGNRYKVLIQPERQEQVWCPPRVETRTVQVWVPGHYKTVQETCPAPAPQPRVIFGARIGF